MNDGKSDLLEVKLVPLTGDDREQFILDNQDASSGGEGVGDGYTLL